MGTNRVHRLPAFVIPLHRTLGPPFPLPFLLTPDEDANAGGGLDAARGRLYGVCKAERAGRAFGAEEPGFTGAVFGACGSAGRRCGVTGES